MILRTILAMAAIGALATLSLASSAVASAQAAGCRPIAGLEQLWAKPSLRWIVVGELHGTNEMPAAFLDIVCHAAATKRPIVVAVERSETEQADIEAFMRSDGGADAERSLLGSVMWQNNSFQDGRSSAAYLALLDQLRLMHRSGAVQKLVAFQPAIRNIDPVRYESEMAKRLEFAAARTDALVLAFVGNCHAMRVALCGNKPAAAYLPSDKTFTINVEGTGGSAWNCGGGCGAHQISGLSPRGEPHLEVLSDPKEPYDAMLFLGGPVSASPPAVAQVDAPPPS